MDWHHNLAGSWGKCALCNYDPNTSPSFYQGKQKGTNKKYADKEKSVGAIQAAESVLAFFNWFLESIKVIIKGQGFTYD